MASVPSDEVSSSAVDDTQDGSEVTSASESAPKRSEGKTASSSSEPRAVADHVLGDQPTKELKEDKLGFEPYVFAVAKFLTHASTEPPLTLSVEGQWGSGKSSFMFQLQDELDKLGKKKIVSFNAWQYNADEGLWAALLSDFDTELNAKLNLGEKLIARFRLLRLRLKWQDLIETIKTLAWLAASAVITYAMVRFLRDGGLAAFLDSMQKSGDLGKAAAKSVAVIGGAGGTIAVLVLFLRQIKDLFRSPASLDKTVALFSKPNYKKQLPLIRQVTRDFNQLVSAYAGKDDVYVFVDDLDRCEYSQAAELVHALLMLLTSAPKIALIIGLDREKVAAALAARQENILPYLYRKSPAEIYNEGSRYGQSFLEKFIQLSFILPSPKPRGLEAMINPAIKPEEPPRPDAQAAAQVIEIVTGEDNDSATLKDMIEMADKVFDHNPRNVKQFVNAFRLNAFIANETGLFRNPKATLTGRLLTIPQLGKFVALCMRWPEFVEGASNDRRLARRMEEWVGSPSNSEGSVSPSSTEESASPHPAELRRDFPRLLSEPGFRALMAYRVGEPDFRCSDLDFKVLTEVSPARAKPGTGFEPARTAPMPDPTQYPTDDNPNPTYEDHAPSRATEQQAKRDREQQLQQQ